MNTNENHREFPFSEEQIFTYISKWIVLNRTEFSYKLKNLTSEINFNEPKFSIIDYDLKIRKNIWQLWKKKVPNTEIEITKVNDVYLVIPTVDIVGH